MPWQALAAIVGAAHSALLRGSSGRGASDRAWSSSAPDCSDACLGRLQGALIAAWGLADEDQCEALFRYRTEAGTTRTVRFELAKLLPWTERTRRVK